MTKYLNPQEYKEALESAFGKDAIARDIEGREGLETFSRLAADHAIEWTIQELERESNTPVPALEQLMRDFGVKDPKTESGRFMQGYRNGLRGMISFFKKE